MTRSQCYRTVPRFGQTTFVLTDSYGEVITDAYDNTFNIHFHKVNDGWSATEESTGARCVLDIYETIEICREKVLECSCLYKKLLSTKPMLEMKERLKAFKERLKQGGEG